MTQLLKNYWVRNNFWILFILIVAACSNNQNNTVDAEQALIEANIKRLEAEIKAKPDSAGVRFLLMDELIKLGRHQEALLQSDTLISMDNRNAGVWFKRGDILLKDEDTTQGIAALERAIEAAPMFAEPWLQLAAVFANRQDTQTLGITQKIIAFAGDTRSSSQAHFINGIYYSNLNNIPKAIAAFDDCIKTDYTFLDAYIEKGLLLFDQQKYGEALAVFNKAQTVSNTFAEAYFQAGRCEEALGNMDEAKLLFQKALGLDNTLTPAREALDKL